MTSISVPCPKCYVVPRDGSTSRGGSQQQSSVVSIFRRTPSTLAGSARFPLLQALDRRQIPILKARVHEVAFDESNSSPIPSMKLESLPSNGKSGEIAEETTSQAVVPDSVISTFMAEVSDLVKLVDSKDIMELQLKQKDCELIIRKRGALPQPSPSAPLIMMQSPQQAMYPPQAMLPPSVSTPTPTGPPPSAPSPAALPPAKGSKSSVPPLKCPMAGTFYRCPGPGEPPFVKVGDKVKKGQVICIIEAMKLMNEIEADQSGTVVEVLAEDGKAVSVDLPLFIIEP